jgi:hypothetical protein
VRSFEIEVQRCTNADLTIWPSPTAVITFDFQLSRDGGATWEQMLNVSAPGGIAKTKFGVDVPTMMVQVGLPAVPNRRVKGTTTLTEAVKTGASLTVL